MRLADALAGTPPRAALAALAILVGALALTGITLHRLVASAMLRELREDSGVELELYRGIVRAEGRAGLLDALAAAPRTPSGPRYAAVLDADGAPLARLGAPPPDGAGRVELAGSVGGLTLVVGRDTAAVERVLDALGAYLALAGLAVTTVCLGIARASGRRSGARLERMADVLDRVARGELGARLATDTGEAGIDRVSARMNGHLDELGRLVDGTRETVRAIAHDLRTPLSRASMRLQAAAAGLAAGRFPEPGGDPAPIGLVEAAQDDLDALGEVFETILRIGRIRAADDARAFGAVRLADVLADIREVYAPVAEADGRRVLIDGDPASAPPVRGDPRMLRQLLANLVENALRHCPRGSTVRLGARDAGAGRTALEVVDDGPGVPAAERRNVLEPFRRLDASRGTPGSGLGLALVDAVARRHGATLRLGDAAPGLRVTVELPAEPVAQDKSV